MLSGATTLATRITDSAGGYLFANLAPGTYTVREPTQPAGTANGLTVAGAVPNGTPGTPTAATVAPSQIAGLALPPGTASTANNFAERPTRTADRRGASSSTATMTGCSPGPIRRSPTCRSRCPAPT